MRDTTQRAATRHDSARRACNLGLVRARPGSWVCALCIRPSYETVHCLGSLFGSLFMDTVHRVKNKNKNKRVQKNKIFVCV